MAKWALVIVLLGAGGWFGYTKWRDRRATRAGEALARVLCGTTLAEEAAGIADQGAAIQGQVQARRGDWQQKRDGWMAAQRALLSRIDQELVRGGDDPSAMKALFSGDPRDVMAQSVAFVTRVHETCPASYNAKKERFQRAIGLIAGSYAVR